MVQELEGYLEKIVQDGKKSNRWFKRDIWMLKTVQDGNRGKR